MRSLHDQDECALAAAQENKPYTNVTIVLTVFGKERPTGCSWHEKSSNLELWKSSSGHCTVNGYAGCFCKIVSGERHQKYNQAN